jgi:hypothetical protein
MRVAPGFLNLKSEFDSRRGNDQMLEALFAASETDLTDN